MAVKKIPVLCALRVSVVKSISFQSLGGMGKAGPGPTKSG
ncbi:hypothetical protein SBV1_2360005 [Verrucomicrobia bacterium]|nr:hypothetical protein SBV1_2360005 [Verrucomicrobiota bacterium]